jgi:hypothetical protein
MTSSALTPSSVADWYKRFGGFSARIFVISFEFEDSTLIRKILKSVCFTLLLSGFCHYFGLSAAKTFGK